MARHTKEEIDYAYDQANIENILQYFCYANPIQYRVEEDPLLLSADFVMELMDLILSYSENKDISKSIRNNLISLINHMERVAPKYETIAQPGLLEELKHVLRQSSEENKDLSEYMLFCDTREDMISREEYKIHKEQYREELYAFLLDETYFFDHCCMSDLDVNNLIALARRPDVLSMVYRFIDKHKILIEAPLCHDRLQLLLFVRDAMECATKSLEFRFTEQNGHETRLQVDYELFSDLYHYHDTADIKELRQNLESYHKGEVPIRRKLDLN